jgi:hypothetical protein
LRLRLLGFSMKPLLGKASVLRFSARFEPRVGDIVLLRFPNGDADKLVAHRVLALEDAQVTTKGDSSRAPDPPTARSRVLATALSLETAGGTVVPLRNLLMRSLGLLLSSTYPAVVRGYRALRPRRPSEEALECAS